MSSDEKKQEALRQVLEYLKTRTKYPTVLELGMADGYHTVQLYGACPTQPCYIGFEPDPRNIEKLKTYQASLMAKIKFYPMAVSDRVGKATLSLVCPDMLGITRFSSIVPLTDRSPWCTMAGTVEVDTTTLDEVIKREKLIHVDVIWVGVQGAELHVFAAAQKTLQTTAMIHTEYGNPPTKEDILKAVGPSWRVQYDTGTDLLLIKQQ
jgi:FkbM family methyltransferase